jgi:hypothetical protein
MTNKCRYNEILMNIFFGREDRDKRRQNNGQTSFCFLSQNETNLFGAYIKKINTFVFWCMAISLGPHLVET